jgi:hypothetical protein
VIRVLTAYTLEIDDVDAAVRDILEQLDLEKNLLKNSAGLLFCYLDFINSGVVKTLCDKLPFDVMGCTSQGFAVQGANEEIMLTLTVLTSDEAEFHSGISEALVQNEENLIASMYQNLTAGKTLNPALLFAFVPMIPNLLGNVVVETLNRESKGTPIFGTIAADYTIDVRSPMTIYKGEAFKDRLPVLLISGDVKPQFFLASLPGDVDFDQKAVITAAEGNRIISLDNIPAADYMEKIGLLKKGNINTLYAFPIVVDYHDGRESHIFTIYKINEDGSLMSDSPKTPGGTLSIGSVTGDLVIESALHITDLIKKETDRNGCFIFSCFSRCVTLTDSQAEAKLVQEQLKGVTLPYVFLYSSGEFCPWYDKMKQTVNQFHQYTVIACIF